MNKNFLTKFLALVCVMLLGIRTSWAEDITVYKWVSTGANASGVTEVGGTASGKIGVNTPNATIGDVYVLQVAGDKIKALKTADQHVLITLADGTFKTGDKITVKGYYSKDQNKETSLAILPGNVEGSSSGEDKSSTTGALMCSDKDWPNLYAATEIATTEHTYELTAAYDGASSITLTRNSSGTTLFIRELYITRTPTSYEIDLKPESVTLPEGFTQVSYPQNAAGYNGTTHGHTWFAVKFAVKGATKITLEGCNYQSGYTGYVTDKDGNKLGDIVNDKCGELVSYTYNSEEENTLTVYCGQYCPYIKVESVPYVAPEPEPGEDPAIDPSTAKLLWDYTEAAPASSPDNGLTYAATVSDPTGTKNGLKGIKMNSSGYAYFTKAAVKGTLKLTLSPRDGTKATVLNVYSYTSEAKAEKLIQATPSVTELQTVSIDLTAAQNNIYINRDPNGAEAVLTKIEFVPYVPRTFKDFEINLVSLSDDYDTSKLPEGVVMEGTNRKDDHGYDNFKLTIPVDGPVKFTVGGCKFSGTTADFKNSKGETLVQLDVKTPGCYHNNGGIAEYIYTGEADVLTFIGAQYSPYFKAEAVEVSPCVVTFKDQNGNVLGKVDTFEGSALGAIPYSASDITVPEGSAFRGWVYASGIKAKAADLLSGNTTISASVTPIESATKGSVQTHSLTSNIYYPEDHETISTQGGYYHDSQHGWAFINGESVSVNVAGNAQVVVGLCQYGMADAIKVTDRDGNEVTTIATGNAATDGATTVVNYTGEANTLTFNFAFADKKETYIHDITVYNLQGDFVTKDEATGYYMVPAGDAAAFLLALNSANAEGNAKIFLPNGTYDLGTKVKTAVSGNNVSIIGESKEGTIIKTTAQNEGLGIADLLQNSSTGLYIQDVTLQNALDYYASGSAGRAACLNDMGTQTIAKNVALLSYQDTYYSHKTGGYYYWEGGEIHGTVDYICGNGNAYFNGITLVNESREKTAGKGDCTITAAQTDKADKGYVFDGCSVETKSATFNLGRSWKDAKTAYLNTTINSGKLVDSRWTLKGMNSAAVAYKEYNTVDKSGNGKNSPASYVAEFTHSNGNTKYETILSDDEAAALSYDKFFEGSSWDPKAIATQVDADIKNIDDAAIYLVEDKDGKFVALVSGANLDLEKNNGNQIRKANERGGFGAPVTVGAPLKGDVNGDDEVNISDVTALVNIILGKATDANGTADVNGDDEVNISDVTALVNIILGK